MTDKQNVIFMDEHTNESAGFKWYRFISKSIKNILDKHNFNIITLQSANNDMIMNKSLLKDIILSKNKDDLYIFTPINFAIFLINLQFFEKKIYRFLNELKYIILWQESLNNDLSVIGYHPAYINIPFITYFFKNSQLNLISNMESIKNLEKHEIFNNIYSPIMGYSLINNIIPFKVSETKNIDVLIYGTMSELYTYRNELIQKIIDSNKDNYVIKVVTNAYGDELDNYLIKTKIVIHVPSHEHLTYIPWPKITYLQSRKVFFIIEENNDLYDYEFDKFMIHYKRNDVNDLYDKIKYYLSNEDEMKKIIDANYEYAIKNNNMDENIYSIISSL